MARMVSLTRSDAEKAADFMPQPSERPDVPPGLCICLTERELEKFDLDDECEVGDLLHLRVMMQVTSVHKSDNGCRIEGSLIAGTVEDESTEGDEDEE